MWKGELHHCDAQPCGRKSQHERCCDPPVIQGTIGAQGLTVSGRYGGVWVSQHRCSASRIVCPAGARQPRIVRTIIPHLGCSARVRFALCFVGKLYRMPRECLSWWVTMVVSSLSGSSLWSRAAKGEGYEA